MSHDHRAILCIALLLVGCVHLIMGSVVIAQAPLEPLTAAAIAEVEQLVRDLDSDTFAIRERASQRLRQMDERIVPYLEAVSESASPEVRMRVAALLKQTRTDPLETFCALPDTQLDEETGMFFIAQILNPKLKKADLQRQLDEIAAKVREQLVAKLGKDFKPAQIEPQRAVATLRKVIFEDLKFRGNKEDYDNPDNCSLERVLATRKGLPLTLSRIVVMVARRVDIPIVGIPASGRYIVKYDGLQAPQGFSQDDIYFHPFEDGKLLSREERLMLFPSHDPDTMVPPDNIRAMLTRALNNLSSDLDHDPTRSAQLTRANQMLEWLRVRPLGLR
jgi:hypothetical protein